MPLKRHIARLLLTVYLLAVGSVAWTSLSCPCVAKSVERHATSCCCCTHSADHLADKEHLSAPCCDNHHSTEIALYTNPFPQDDERGVKRVVTQLPLFVPHICPLQSPERYSAAVIVARDCPLLLPDFPQGCPLRAPPVLV